MKYLLTSQGLRTRSIRQALETLGGKSAEEISVAIINEAHAVEDGDKRWNIAEIANTAKVLGGEVDLVNLLALDKSQIFSRINACDVIFVVGGNTDYLRSVYLKSGFDEVLSQLGEDKVYVGSSAGSMVLGIRLPNNARSVLYNDQEIFGTESYLELFDFSFVPHMDGDTFFSCRRNIVMENLSTFEPLTYCLTDDQALSIENGEVTFVGGTPLAIKNGEVISETSLE